MNDDGAVKVRTVPIFVSQSDILYKISEQIGKIITALSSAIQKLDCCRTLYFIKNLLAFLVVLYLNKRIAWGD